ncbi:MAG: hypothetical protein ACREJC_17030, partial [Tepidisphaeraceae bacterium]
MRHGTTVYGSTDHLQLAPHTWTEASSPEDAALQLVSGYIVTHYPSPAPSGHDETRTFPGGSFRIYYDNPATGAIDFLPLHFDPVLCAYVGVIAVEDWTDADYDDQFWDLMVRPFECTGTHVRITTVDADAGESPDPNGSPDVPNPGKFILKRVLPDPMDAVTVQFHRPAGSATYGDDYLLFADGQQIVPNSSTGRFSVTIPEDEEQVEIEIRPVDDELPEDSETVAIYPMADANTSVRYWLDNASTAPATIGDNDNVTADIVVRKISHGSASGDLPSAEEMNPGAFLPVNNDDDDYNQKPDSTQDGALVGNEPDTDLLEIVLKKATPAEGNYNLKLPSGFRAWRNRDHTGKINATKPIDASADTTVFLEATKKAAGQIVKLDWVSADGKTKRANVA